ncbi:hypothetical protein CWD94_16950 [Lysinibacillus xylanilyticus]|uniref:Uncharacterized protein n=1 Tax=Lysinibacillus xylanilyticus TaxID=582475 RepID=A0A2M9Q3C8_9BACI|nr:hypothetical protein CWD94_16950 [Lysinibacillus xylanilyticus]
MIGVKTGRLTDAPGSSALRESEAAAIKVPSRDEHQPHVTMMNKIIKIHIPFIKTKFSMRKLFAIIISSLKNSDS